MKEIIIAENGLIRLYSIEEKKKFFEEKQYLSVENLIKINMNYAKITPIFYCNNPSKTLLAFLSSSGIWSK